MARGPVAWLVCYDITADNRRTAVYRTLRGYGDHIQYSVFRCVVSARQFASMRAELEELIDHKKDQVLLVPLGPPDEDRLKAWVALGLSVQPLERTVVIL